MTVTACPRIESPRNSRRSLWASPPCSYAYERWVSASCRSSGSMTIPSASDSRARPSGTSASPEGRAVDSDVGDLPALVLHVQGGAGGVLDDLGAVRERVDGLAVLDRLDELHRR